MSHIWASLAIEHSHRVSAVGSVRTVLERVADTLPVELQPQQIWAGLEAAGPRERSAFASFYLDVVKIEARYGGLSLEGQANLSRLRRTLRLEEGDLLRLRRDDVARVVYDQLAHQYLDDRIDPVEALQQVALQQALGLSYDEYSELASSIVLPKLRALLVEAKGGLPRDQFQCRLAALDAFVRPEQL